MKTVFICYRYVFLLLISFIKIYRSIFNKHLHTVIYLWSHPVIQKKNHCQKITAGSDSIINIFTQVFLFFHWWSFSPKLRNDFHIQHILCFFDPRTITENQYPCRRHFFLTDKPFFKLTSSSRYTFAWDKAVSSFWQEHLRCGVQPECAAQKGQEDCVSHMEKHLRKERACAPLNRKLASGSFFLKDP